MPFFHRSVTRDEMLNFLSCVRWEQVDPKLVKSVLLDLPVGIPLKKLPLDLVARLEEFTTR